jgi:hypothetical protein
VTLETFRQIWCVDFEFGAPAGERPDPVCLVAWELRSGTRMKLWADEMRQRRLPPYSIDRDSLFIAYFASAELGCHLALGWPLPENVLDLYVEFRNHTNGKITPAGSGLVGALAWFGLNGLDATEKDDMRALVLRGGPWTDSEQQAILEYCSSDVCALARLLPVMAPNLDVPRALLRGRYMAAVARMEHIGVPLNGELLEQLRGGWEHIQDELIREIDSQYGVFDGRSFRSERFARWLVEHNIAWPQLPSGALALDDDTFKTQTQRYPELRPLRELRISLSQMRLADLAVGKDGRNRTLLSPFRTKTSRNAPSNTKFIFGPSKWLRGLIQPTPGHGLAYIDWSQQEFGIAAALSGDAAMQLAYRTADPYLAFAKQAGAAPGDATKETHGLIREQYKAVVLGTQYGMRETTLAQRIGVPPCHARELLRDHRRTYRKFWEWTDGAVAAFNLNGKVWSVFGWQLFNGDGTNSDRTVLNFPMQANGAEMMRMACIRLTEAGIAVCAPVHDAILIEAPLSELDNTVQDARQLMAAASGDVLSGFELRTDATLIRYPDRYRDERGQEMWTKVVRLLTCAPVQHRCAPVQHQCA